MYSAKRSPYHSQQNLILGVIIKNIFQNTQRPVCAGRIFHALVQAFAQLIDRVGKLQKRKPDIAV